MEWKNMASNSTFIKKNIKLKQNSEPELGKSKNF